MEERRQGTPLRKADVGTARNYLGETEIKELNLIVEAFLNNAELRAKRRQSMRLTEWGQALDDILALSELPKLRGTGNVAARDAERIAHEHYAEFDASGRKPRGMLQPRQETYRS